MPKEYVRATSPEEAIRIAGIGTAESISVIPVDGADDLFRVLRTHTLRSIKPRDRKGNVGIVCPQCGEFIAIGDEPTPTRPIPLSAGLPAVGQRVFIHVDDSWGPDVGGWHSAKLSPTHSTNPNSCDDGFNAIAGPCHWKLSEVTHWLPMFPKPE